MILPVFRRRPQARSIAVLYGAIVARARSVVFYTGYGVPDTVEGRFDLIVLHLVLLLRRLERDEALKRDLGQELFDEFCRDLDANLREMGIGDLAVPKRMQGFAEAFYGRQAAYLTALAAPGDGDFETALARNIFSDSSGDGAARLARYARAVAGALDAQTDEALRRGEVTFANADAFCWPVTHESQRHERT